MNYTHEQVSAMLQKAHNAEMIAKSNTFYLRATEVQENLNEAMKKCNQPVCWVNADLLATVTRNLAAAAEEATAFYDEWNRAIALMNQLWDDYRKVMEEAKAAQSPEEAAEADRLYRELMAKDYDEDKDERDQQERQDMDADSRYC